MDAPTLLSIQVGRPTTYPFGTNANDESTWTTAFFKSPVAGPVFVGRTNVAGDAQADLEHHGGIDKAVLAYAAGHYKLWHSELKRRDMVFGGFGENLTIQGTSEDEVCIGDLWSLGETLMQVTQPRQPCWKLARRWGIKELTALVVENGRCGWYLRVMREGFIDVGQPLVLIERPNPTWTIARAHQVMHHDRHNAPLARELAAVPELSLAWKTSLTNRAARQS